MRSSHTTAACTPSSKRTLRYGGAQRKMRSYCSPPYTSTSSYLLIGTEGPDTPSFSARLKPSSRSPGWCNLTIGPISQISIRMQAQTLGWSILPLSCFISLLYIPMKKTEGLLKGNHDLTHHYGTLAPPQPSVTFSSSERYSCILSTYPVPRATQMPLSGLLRMNHLLCDDEHVLIGLGGPLFYSSAMYMLLITRWEPANEREFGGQALGQTGGGTRVGYKVIGSQVCCLEASPNGPLRTHCYWGEGKGNACLWAPRHSWEAHWTITSSFSTYFYYPRGWVSVCEREREGGRDRQTEAWIFTPLHTASSHFVVRLGGDQQWDLELGEGYEGEAFHQPPCPTLGFPLTVLATFLKWPEQPCTPLQIAGLLLHPEDEIIRAVHQKMQWNPKHQDQAKLECRGWYWYISANIISNLLFQTPLPNPHG